MKYDNDERPRVLANYLVEHNSTVRATAKAFGISKSTVHKDITYRLKRIDPPLSAAVNQILEKNKSERHLRGGNATKLKYEGAKCTKISH
ncbi:MAG: stage III sporulation protein D [Clostridiales bacterium]|nr:stage III sporulation protein D [Clostridiales bacterium]